MQEQSVKAKKGFMAALIGTVVVILCCFTPLLVVVLSAIGLAALTSYLDFLLLPALVIMIVVTIIAYRRWQRAV